MEQGGRDRLEGGLAGEGDDGQDHEPEDDSSGEQALAGHVGGDTDDGGDHDHESPETEDHGRHSDEQFHHPAVPAFQKRRRIKAMENGGGKSDGKGNDHGEQSDERRPDQHRDNAELRIAERPRLPFGIGEESAESARRYRRPGSGEQVPDDEQDHTPGNEGEEAEDCLDETVNGPAQSSVSR